MKKKYQVFVSSTFSDLINERQSCVEAILRAGHIPAGMELFSAGNESQLEIIRRWIEESDIYMLLLGGRYGSIEPSTGLSYTEIEYQYAQELNIPVFAIVMHEELLNKKVKENGKDVLELESPDKYKKFKELVLSKISRFFRDDNEIKLSILESLLDIQSRHELNGWVRAADVPDVKQIIAQNVELEDRTKNLEEELKIVESSRLDKIGDYKYEDIVNALKAIEIIVPAELSINKKARVTNALDLFYKHRSILSIGLSNRVGTSNDVMFLIRNLISHLRIYNLAEIVKVSGVAWVKFQTSKMGNKFIAMYEMKKRSTKKNS
ncbi:MAG: hypothetical protein VR77_08600 [Flavobacteriales bacterium BRH_c54]|nr:MAG: hypothetical protein VR77_08600 [Flavobacteriales bacterium BRH_c54]